MEADEEARLVAAARGGDMRAFGRLVDAHQAPVRAFLRRLTGNWADADDLSQDAFARVWEVLHKLRRESRFRPFVCGVAYHYWRRTRRSALRRTRREQDYMELEQSEWDEARDPGMRLALRRAMEAMAPDQRAALALCLGAEFTHAEAADALKLPLGTVKSHVLRGRARLRAALGIEDEVGHDA